MTLLVGGIFNAVIGGGGGIFWYYQHHQRIVVQEKLVRDDSLDFLKGVEITMKVDPPAPKKPHPGVHPHSKNGKNEFSDVTNLGDASEGGGDETLDQTVVQRVMTQNFRALVGCIGEVRLRETRVWRDTLLGTRYEHRRVLIGRGESVSHDQRRLLAAFEVGRRPPSMGLMLGLGIAYFMLAMLFTSHLRNIG